MRSSELSNTDISFIDEVDYWGNVDNLRKIFSEEVWFQLFNLSQQKDVNLIIGELSMHCTEEDISDFTTKANAAIFAKTTIEEFRKKEFKGQIFNVTFNNPANVHAWLTSVKQSQKFYDTLIFEKDNLSERSKSFEAKMLKHSFLAKSKQLDFFKKQIQEKDFQLNSIPFPKFPQEQKFSLLNTISYLPTYFSNQIRSFWKGVNSQTEIIRGEIKPQQVEPKKSSDNQRCLINTSIHPHLPNLVIISSNNELDNPNIESSRNSKILELKTSIGNATKNYIEKNTFTPWCLGFFGVSGNIGLRRAKRFINLLNNASDDGVLLVAEALLNSNINIFKTYLDPNLATTIKDIKSDLKLNDSKNPALELVIDYLNVINYSGEDFNDPFNKLVSTFSYSNKHEDEIKQLTADMKKALAINSVTSPRY